MKRSCLICTILALLANCISVFGQSGIVHDPVQTAMSSADASSSLTEMINILDQIFEGNEVTKDLREFQKRNFGEGSWGEKAKTRLQQLGYIEDMVASFNATTKVATEYVNMLKRSDIDAQLVNDMTKQILQMALQAKQLVEYCKVIFEAEDKTTSEKEDAVRMAKDSLLKVQLNMYDYTIQKLETAKATASLVSFDDFIDDALSADAYVIARKAYGTVTSSKTGLFQIIYTLLGFLGILSLIWAWISMVRGGASGDETSQMGFIRIGVAMMGASLVLSVIDSIFNSILL